MKDGLLETERHDSMIRRRQARHSFDLFPCTFRPILAPTLFRTFPSTLVDIRQPHSFEYSLGPDSSHSLRPFPCNKPLRLLIFMSRSLSGLHQFYVSTPSTSTQLFASWITILRFHDFINILLRIDSPLST